MVPGVNNVQRPPRNPCAINNLEIWPLRRTTFYHPFLKLCASRFAGASPATPEGVKAGQTWSNLKMIAGRLGHPSAPPNIPDAAINFPNSALRTPHSELPSQGWSNLVKPKKITMQRGRPTLIPHAPNAVTAFPEPAHFRANRFRQPVPPQLPATAEASSEGGLVAPKPSDGGPHFAATRRFCPPASRSRNFPLPNQ